MRVRRRLPSSFTFWLKPIALVGLVTLADLSLIGGGGGGDAGPVRTGMALARANPIIADALQAIHFPELSFALWWRAMFWLLVSISVWATLRPAHQPQSLRPKSLRSSPGRRFARPWLFGVSTASVVSALSVFNALFALENGLDIAFLWSGAPLPAGVTLAEYAHRGAYPLIFTALLAGGFSLLLLRKGSATAASPLVRWLVGAWAGQNVLLSASSLLRTADYVQAYSLRGSASRPCCGWRS